MSALERCLEKLDRAGLDVLNVGYSWQEKTPLTAYQMSEQIKGVLILIASCLLLYVMGEIARSHFKN